MSGLLLRTIAALQFTYRKNAEGPSIEQMTCHDQYETTANTERFMTAHMGTAHPGPCGILAEFILEKGEPLPPPNPRAKDKAAAYQETIVVEVRCTVGVSNEKTKAAEPSAKSRVRLRAGGR